MTVQNNGGTIVMGGNPGAMPGDDRKGYNPCTEVWRLASCSCAKIAWVQVQRAGGIENF